MISGRAKMPKITMHVLWLPVLMLLAEGLTPLMIAAELKNKGALELLQARPKNRNSQDLRIKTAKDRPLPVKVLGSLTNRLKIVNKYIGLSYSS